LDFFSIFREANHFLDTFNDIFFLMGEEAVHTLLQAMVLSPTTVIMVLLVHYPRFLTRTIPFQMIGVINIEELGRLFFVGLNRVQSRLQYLNQRINFNIGIQMVRMNNFFATNQLIEGTRGEVRMILNEMVGFNSQIIQETTRNLFRRFLV
jgi:hypothetical protein